MSNGSFGVSVIPAPAVNMAVTTSRTCSSVYAAGTPVVAIVRMSNGSFGVSTMFVPAVSIADTTSRTCSSVYAGPPVAASEMRFPASS